VVGEVCVGVGWERWGTNALFNVSGPTVFTSLFTNINTKFG
jgi:hypothetical protein